MRSNAERATHCREIKYNDLVLVGPGVDPADMSTAECAADAFQRIAR